MRSASKHYLLPALCFLLSSAAWADTSLTTTGVVTQTGGPMTITVNFNPGASAVVAMQFDLTLPPGQTLTTVTPGTILTQAGKSISTNLVSTSTYRFILSGFNSNVISSGTLLTAQATTAAGTAPESIMVPLSNSFYSTSNGDVTTLPVNPLVLSLTLQVSTSSYSNGQNFPYGVNVNVVVAPNSGHTFSACYTNIYGAMSPGVGGVYYYFFNPPPMPGAYSDTITCLDSSGGNATIPFNFTIQPPAPPMANLAVFPSTTGVAPLLITADASASTGMGITYAWDFGDGTTANWGSSQSHTYAAGGTYILRVTVTDVFNSTSTATQVITVTSTNTAAFLKTDTTTQGSWKGVYGVDGEAINSDSTNFPAYAQVTFTNSANFAWANSTADIRAPQQNAGSSRIASCWYSATTYSIDLNLTDGQSHQVGFYLLDWDNYQGGRSEHMDITDETSGVVLSSRTVSGFQNGQYWVWNISGHVKVTFTNLGGSSSNAVLSGIFFGGAGVIPAPVITSAPSATGTVGSPFNYQITASNNPASFNASTLPAGLSLNTTTGFISGTLTTAGVYGSTISATNAGGTGAALLLLTINNNTSTSSAAYLKTDTTTQGSWKGVYGVDGEAINSDSTNFPSYAQVSFSNSSNFVWANTTTDIRAPLQNASNSRIASCWYSAANYSIDVNLTDGQSHQVGFYLLDWDNYQGGRSEHIDIADSATGVILSSRTISGFQSGQYWVWTIRGHVKVTFTNLGGSSSNAVMSGIFFGSTGSVAAPVITSAPSATGTVGSPFNYQITATNSPTSFNASTLPAGLTVNTATGLISGTPTAAGVFGSTITATNAGGTGSSLLLLTISSSSGSLNSAVYLKTDATTEGTWKGVYGADGEAINSDSTNFPSYAQVSFANSANFVWANTTADIRAPQQNLGSSRIASCWYSATTYTVDVNLTDGQTHQVSFYLLDWDNWQGGRAERIDITDGATGALLDRRTVLNFQNGQYWIWTIRGHVKVTFTNLGGSATNAVLSGIFFNNAGSSGSNIQIGTETSPLDGVRVYPNPVREYRGNQTLTFDQLPLAGSTIKIFTVSARLVTTLQASSKSVSWTLTNDAGDKVASGIYLYLITDGQGNKIRGKFTIIK